MWGFKWKSIKLILALNFGISRAARDLPPMEREHQPYAQNPERIVNGTAMPGPEDTPDFRIEEPSWFAYKPFLYIEEERPFRMSPFYKQATSYKKYGTGYDDPWTFGCYCCTVYKRLTPLAGCALITSKHILTTATSTELVLKEYGGNEHLYNILGAWYDDDSNSWNSSYYLTPASIHYHPKYIHPNLVNTSHPLPFTFDLAVWCATHTVTPGGYLTTSLSKGVICARGGSSRWTYLSPVPRWNELAIIVGFQYVKSHRKVPMPWFRYVVRTRKVVYPCPKSEWGWMLCLAGNWAKYGIESGAAWHRCNERNNWSYDGLIALCAFSMHLRSNELTHYFNIVDTHPVLDFLYNSFTGRLHYRFKDFRFYVSWNQPVQPYTYNNIIVENYPGEQLYYKVNLPYYK